MSLGTVDIRCGKAKLCSVSPEGLVETTCTSTIRIGAEGCRVGPEASLKRAFCDSQYEVLEFDRTYLLSNSSIESVDKQSRVTPQHLFALLLRQLHYDMTSKAGIHVAQLILPEPPGPTKVFREQAASAAELVGLRVQSFVKESVAACQYYSRTVTTAAAASSFLVLQFGHDGISASLLKKLESGFHVVNENVDASSIHPILQALLQLVAGEVSRRFGSSFTSQELKGELLRIAKRMLHELQVCRAGRVRIIDWIQDQPIDIQLQRDHFERLLEPAIIGGIKTAEACLSRANCAWEQIDKVILLGELASVPAVIHGICAASGKAQGDVIGRNSDLAVAAGASILGTALKPFEARRAQCDIGLRVVQWQPSEKAEDRFVITAGAALPTSITTQYYTRSSSQNSMLLKLVCKKKDGTTFELGELELGPLCGTRRGFPVDITLAMSSSHLVTLSVRDGILGTIEEHYFDPINTFHPSSSDRQIWRRLKVNR